MEIYVVNVKCSGCANTVKKALEKEWFENIKVHFSEEDSHLKRKITFDWDKQKALEILEDLWYPEYGSKKAESYLKKAKSFVSCAVWKIDLKTKK